MAIGRGREGRAILGLNRNPKTPEWEDKGRRGKFIGETYTSSGICNRKCTVNDETVESIGLGP